MLIIQTNLSSLSTFFTMIGEIQPIFKRFFISIFRIYIKSDFQMKTTKASLRREDNWKKYPYLFNECKNLVFECECGKKYESFPGLYLHFQRKHGQKISTKFNPNQCHIVKQDQKITYKYTLDEKRDEKLKNLVIEQTSNEKQRISTVLSKFVLDFSSKGSHLCKYNAIQHSNSDVLQIIQEFQKYIDQKQIEQNSKQSIDTILAEIPLHFNDFVRENYNISSGLQYWKVCTTLFQLSEWLRKTGHSELILQFIDYGPQCK